jgi:GH3 auxin-responsive promoter
MTVLPNAPGPLLGRIASRIGRMRARRRLAELTGQDAAATQQKTLLALVRKAQNTRFGRDHDFAGITDVASFQARVPLRRYDDFWRDYWQSAFPTIRDVTWPGTYPYFAMSSGTTTGLNKYIPTSHELIATNAHTVRDMFVQHYANRGASNIFAGKVFMLGGSTALTPEAPGIQSGDMSGIEANEMPWLARRFFFPPPELALIADYDDKIDRLVKASIDLDIRAIIGPPNWMLVFFDRLLRHRVGADRLVKIWPNLKLVLHGGMNFTPYRDRFKAILQDTPAETREIYAASEGFFAVADHGDGEGMRLLVDHGIFYEFVPVEDLDQPTPRRYWLGTIEPGVEYAMILTTCSGAWSYVIGDTVRFVETKPPRLLVTGRTAYVLTAFGEHVIAEQLDDAISHASRTTGLSVIEYSASSGFPAAGSVAGQHRHVVEFAGGQPGADRLTAFAAALDARLIAINEDYQRRRANDIGLLPPEIMAVAPGSFERWMQARGKRGGQHKVPRIINDPALFDTLIGTATA